MMVTTVVLEMMQRNKWLLNSPTTLTARSPCVRGCSLVPYVKEIISVRRMNINIKGGFQIRLPSQPEYYWTKKVLKIILMSYLKNR